MENTREQLLGNCIALEKELAALDRQTNTLTLSQFSKYIPLYQKQSDVEVPMLKDLAYEFAKAINPYKPIRIIGDMPDEDGNEMEAFTLPSVWVPVSQLGDGNSKSGEIVTTFNNILHRHSVNPIQTDLSSAFELMFSAIAISQRAQKGEINDHLREYVEIMRKLKPMMSPDDGDSVVTEDAIDSDVGIDDMDWE